MTSGRKEKTGYSCNKEETSEADRGAGTDRESG